MNMHCRIELHRGNDRGIDIDEIPDRMIGEKMPAAILAPLPEAPVGPMICADAIDTFSDLHAVRCPQREGVDGSGGPLPAGTAVAITHGHRLTGYLKFNRAAEALSIAGHCVAHFNLHFKSSRHPPNQRPAFCLEHVPEKCAHFADKNMLQRIESGALCYRRSDHS